MSGSLPIKCYLSVDGSESNEIRRFTLDSEVVGNFTYLMEKIRAIYPQLLRENFHVMYIDEENDKVTISSDDELVSALMFANRQDKEPFRVFIQLAKVSGKRCSSTSGEPQGNNQGDLHIGVTCDGCQGAIKGFRYKCLQCPDYDLCGKCEMKGIHPAHTFIRVSGRLPASWMAMRQLLNEGRDIPTWRRNHPRSRSGHCNPHGRWNAWCPSGINVEIDPQPSCGQEKDEGKKDETCPWKVHIEKAKQAAQAFQEATGNEFLHDIGNTISTLLEQFGIETLVDVQTSESEPKLPSGCFKPEQKKEEKIEKPEEKREEMNEKPTEEPPKETIIPVQVEEVQKDEAPKEDVTATPEPLAAAADRNPYAALTDAAVAVNKPDSTPIETPVPEQVVETSTPVFAVGAYPILKSPTRDSDDWTIVDEQSPSAAKAAVSNASTLGLGARPKPPPQINETPLHPDPLIAGALETMMAMGFTNEGGWLVQLLQVKNGDIGKVLDVLQSNRRH
jgi:sequestosome 1